MIFAAESNKPLQKNREESLSLCGGCHKGIAHHSMRHLATALGKLRITPDVRPELEPLLVLHRERHVDELGSQVELQARLPLPAVPNAAVIGVTPGT
jgi:hypothetical protein